MIKLEVLTRQNNIALQGNVTECIAAVITEDMTQHDDNDKVTLFMSEDITKGFESFSHVKTIPYYEYKTEFMMHIKNGFQYRFAFDLTEETILSNMYGSIMSIITNS